MALDFTKPVQTRNGRTVRILRTDRKDINDNYPIVGLVTSDSGREFVCFWDVDGFVFSPAAFKDHDLVQTPSRHPYADVIIAYAEGASVQYRMKESRQWQDWMQSFCPAFHSDLFWRIKP